MIPDMLAEALALAERGVSVFPVHTIRDGFCSCGKPDCKSPGKHPRTQHSWKDATRDPAVIENWWAQWPDANIAVATGKVSGIVVLDIDGEKGEARLQELEAQFAPLLETVEVRTGRGRHLWFRYPKDVDHIPSSAGDGLDVRADGGYVVVPPSVHASGRSYEWAQSEITGWPELPVWGVDYVCRKHKSDSARDLAVDSPRTNTKAVRTEAEVLRIKSALAVIPAEQREVWLRMGMALHWTGWPDAFAIWDEWSRKCPSKYDEDGQQKAWQSFDRGMRARK
jgi:hypothetical protein